jgi:hypothetical protein
MTSDWDDDWVFVPPQHTLRRPENTYSCGGCDVAFTGLRTAHCTTCHETFTTIGNFDTHRVSVRGKRPLTPSVMQPQAVTATGVRCLSIEEMESGTVDGESVPDWKRLVRDHRGYWHKPGSEEWSREQ